MNYIFMCGVGIGECYMFFDILFGGFVKDGGFYLFVEYLKVLVDEFVCWCMLLYVDFVFEILLKFCDDVLVDDLCVIMCCMYMVVVYSNMCYGENVFDIMLLKMFGIEYGVVLLLFELLNGLMFVFKDMVMQLFGNLFEYMFVKYGEVLNIFGVMLGDIGSVVEYVMCGKVGVCVFMLLLYKKMSVFQMVQMFSLQDLNIFNFVVEGVFDDCQDIVKVVLNDYVFKVQQRIGIVNLINWVCVVVQVVYYFKGYFVVMQFNDECVLFMVLLGNFGNVCVGYIVWMMGLLIVKLVVVINENDVFDEFFCMGVYCVCSVENIYYMSSLSMDILKVLNFECFVFDLFGCDLVCVMQLFCDVEEKGGFDFVVSGDFVCVVEFGFVLGCSSYIDCIVMICDVFLCYDMMIDMYMVDGVKVVCEYLEVGVLMVVFEMVQLIKFGEMICEVFDCEVEWLVVFDGFEVLLQCFEVVKVDVQQVKDFIVVYMGV